MSYLLFLVVLAATAIVWGVGRLFGSKISYETVFYVIGSAVMMLPVAAMCLMMMISIAVAAGLLGALALHLLGLLPAVEHLSIWQSLPEWAWYTLGAVSFGPSC